MNACSKSSILQVVGKFQFWMTLIAMTLVLNLILGCVVMQTQQADDQFWTVLRRSIARQWKSDMQYLRLLHRRTKDCGHVVTTNTTLPPLGFWKQLSQTNTTTGCFAPPPTSCHADGYSVILTSNGQQLRRVVLKIMALQTYPSVRDITVLIRSSKKQLRHDARYGQRLLDWKNVTVVPLHSLWFGLETVLQRKLSESIVWLDADRDKHWNATTLRRTWNAWKEESDALRQPHGCGDLHASIFHSNLLCYVDHDVSRELRQYVVTQQASWELEAAAIGLLIGNLARRVDAPGPNARIRTELLDYFGGCCNARSSVQRDEKPRQCQ